MSGIFGGGRWIRTTEVTDNRFTVCPLWPLGNSPIFTCALKRKLGAGRRTRTPDLLITNQLLYQLSYTSEFSFRSRIHSLISSAYIIYHILHHLSTLFSNFFNFFEAYTPNALFYWVSYTFFNSKLNSLLSLISKIM